MKKTLYVKNKKLKMPAFFPDATYGKVKAVSSKDLKKCNIDGVVVNAYHMLKHNLIDKIENIGVHKYMNLNKVIISDSGGFQVMSLIRNNPELGKIYDDKVVFLLDNKKIELTPENCIEIQIRLGSDIVMCLDDCTHADISDSEKKKSVERTINWARRCKREFVRLTYHMKKKPKLFAIIQGGENKKLRKYCFNELEKIGFDGYSFGGWPVKNKKLLKGILKYVSDLIPDTYLKYAMGVGKPKDVAICFSLGYDMFDCVIPTRDARHKRLYFFKKKFSKKELLDGDFYFEINVRKKYFKKNLGKCSCELCKNYSLEELYEMFKNNYEKAARIATIHNLTFYSEMMKKLRKL